jgi:hypothetical protein
MNDIKASGGDILFVDGDLSIANEVETLQQLIEFRVKSSYDFIFYPDLGADLQSLFGLPQDSSTGNLGISLINSSLNKYNFPTGLGIRVDELPTSEHEITFYVFMNTGSKQRDSVPVTSYVLNLLGV